jgi:high-affinity nickel permease
MQRWCPAPDNQVRNDSSGLHNVTGIIGTTVSGTFLYLIGAINLVVLYGIVKVFREMPRLPSEFLACSVTATAEAKNESNNDGSIGRSRSRR